MVRLKVQEDNIKLKMNAPDGATFRTNEYTPIMSGSSDYNELDNKPSINGHTLEGDQSSEDLDLFSGDYNDLINKPNLFSGDYDDLTDKPSINGNTLEGDMTTEELGIHIPTNVSELGNDEGFISSPNVVYCSCDTIARTAEKVATIVSGKLTSLNTGDQAIVRFTYTNTVANPTLKIGDTDAKAIKRYGTTSPSTNIDNSWNAGNSFLFVYDGTYWQMVSWINTVKGEIAEVNITNGSSSVGGLITGRRAKSAVDAFAPVKDVQVNGTSVVREGVAEILNYRTEYEAVSVWDYCDGSQISMQNGSPILYTDTQNNRQYLIETWQAVRQPTYNYQKVTDLIDSDGIYQRSGTYTNGITTWGDWYKFTGTVFTPPTGR